MRIEQAVALARRFHERVTDKAGRPYIEHCLRVMGSVDGPDEKLVAAMHDLLEDTSLVPGDLLAAGAPPRIVAAVEALTRRPDEEYSAFVRRAASDPLARAVKLSDIEDNADERRLSLLEAGEAEVLRRKYAEARNTILDAPPAVEPERGWLSWAMRPTLASTNDEVVKDIGQDVYGTWVTCWCPCGHPAGTFEIVRYKAGQPALSSVSSFGMKVLPLANERVAEIVGLLERGEMRSLATLRRQFSPWYCLKCDSGKCLRHMKVTDDGRGGRDWWACDPEQRPPGDTSSHGSWVD